MRRATFWRLFCGLLLTCLLPTAASAQSTIAGLVTDATGAVMPGVTVEASSPALIEKVRAVTTDAEGRYAIIDIRPGTYTVSFTLPGFTNVRREGIEVESNANVPINAELRVGAVEETITVSGATPVVDLRTVESRETINREQAETLPITGNPAQMLALMPGANVIITNGRAGVQGATENVFVEGRGLGMYETRWNVDGMDARSGNLSGLANLRLNREMIEETVFTTFGANIESPTGGVSLNMIPRDGGNRYSGTFLFTGNSKSWVSDNFSQQLRDRGATVTTTLGANTDRAFSAGGPIQRDRLWFYTSWRRQSTLQYQADVYDAQAGVRDEKNWYLLNPLPNWHQLEEKSNNHSVSGRLTGQLSQKQKLTAYYDRGFNRDYYSDEYSYFWDQWRSKDYLGQIKYTNTATSRLLFDTGLSLVSYNHHGDPTPALDYPRGSPGWFQYAARRDSITGRELYDLQLSRDGRFSLRKAFSANLTYVTGSHSAKGGVQLGDAWDHDNTEINGDIVMSYQNGVPDSVRAYNTPSYNWNNVNLELGVYAGDTWALKRLTVTGGVRFDHWDASIPEYKVPPGRFTALKNQKKTPAPIQNNFSGRIGATYDLFGNARTAIKGSFGKYLANVGVTVLRQFNPQGLGFTTLDWIADTNGDGIAQDHEIESIQTLNPNFYNSVIPESIDPEWEREYNFERSIGVQHQLARGLAAHASYYHRQRYNLQWTDRLAVSSKDYFPLQVVTPPGEVVTVYNLPDSLRTSYLDSPLVFRSEKDQNALRVEYDSVEAGFDGRLPWGGRAFGGWSMERNVTITCQPRDNPNLLRFCDELPPFRHTFKVAGTQRLPGSIDASVTLNSQAGRALPVNWTITRTLRYTADCAGPCRPGDFVVNNPRLNGASIALPLVKPGTSWYGRYSDLGIGISKVFQFGRTTRLRAGLNIFNTLNSSTVITQVTNRALASFGRPSLTQDPRVIQASARFSF